MTASIAALELSTWSSSPGLLSPSSLSPFDSLELSAPSSASSSSESSASSLWRFYVSNRDAGTISVVDPAAGESLATWTIPGGGSPDMGGVSADGGQFWVSGRDDDEVYVFDTATGKLLARIPVGANPHGLAFFPQPGRYSMGHTGNYR